MAKNDIDNWVTIPEAAQITGYAARKLLDWIARGHIAAADCRRLGARAWVVREAMLGNLKPPARGNPAWRKEDE